LEAGEIGMEAPAAEVEAGSGSEVRGTSGEGCLELGLGLRELGESEEAFTFGEVAVSFAPGGGEPVRAVVAGSRRFRGIEEGVEVVTRGTTGGLAGFGTAGCVAGGAEGSGGGSSAGNAVRLDVVAFVDDVALAGAVAGDAVSAGGGVAGDAPFDDGDHVAAAAGAGLLKMLVLGRGGKSEGEKQD
jgi:hypothetical protein